MYDLVIIGGGPAGATLARLAAAWGQVLLLEKRPAPADPDSPDWRKTCGGLIAPAALKALADMKLAVPPDVTARPQSMLVRAVDLDGRRERCYRRRYLNVHRGRLDRWLLSLVPPSVEVQYGARLRAVEPRGDAVTVYYRWGKAAVSVEARVAAAADGAASRVRRIILPGRPAPRIYVAIQEWLADVQSPPQANGAPCYTAIFDRAVTDFYAWTIPKDDLLIVGAAMPAEGRADSRFRLLRSRLAERLGIDGQVRQRERTILLRPARVGHVRAGRGRVLLLGEAAGLISPSSGEGLGFAFRSAMAAAGALRADAHNPLPGYQRRLLPLKAAVGMKLLKSAAIFTPPARSLLMLSGLGAAPDAEA